MLNDYNVKVSFADVVTINITFERAKESAVTAIMETVTEFLSADGWEQDEKPPWAANKAYRVLIAASDDLDCQKFEFDEHTKAVSFTRHLANCEWGLYGPIFANGEKEIKLIEKSGGYIPF